MTMTLSTVGGALGVGRDAGPSLALGWSIDSRTVQADDVFFAIEGPNHDGHDHVEDAFAKGAAAAVVRRQWQPSEEAGDGFLFRVDEPAAALAQLAAFARRRWAGRVIAVTGSNGKTTTKEATAALLATRYRVSKTEGNLNNELGLPLSILRIADDSEAAVLEMGMNHAGEIRRMARIASPDVGVVTNVSAAHVGFFESEDAVALAKRELIEELPAQATAVLNADDERVRAFGAVRGGPAVTFGFSENADYRAADVELGPEGSSFRLKRKGARGAGVAFKTRLPGRHNILNLSAALAVCGVMEIELSALRRAVAAFEPAKMRGQVIRLGGLTILDDCYNSNPAAAKAMIEALAQLDGGRMVAVLGEMRELGAQSPALHREVGRAAAAAGVELLIGVGGDAKEVLAGAIQAGMAPVAVEFFDDAEAAGRRLPDLLREGDRVLFKASRGVGLEKALRAATAAKAGSA
jgi:UDP-N-acetylmuramoyl-tripeptide--D-alanyl-D-alanine ligase